MSTIDHPADAPSTAVSAAVHQLVAAVLGGAPRHSAPFRCATPHADSGCGCRECVVLRHLPKATCWFADCEKPSKLRMTRWWHQGTYKENADPGDPRADDEGLVELPCDPRSGEFDEFHVCGTVHARRVLDANPDFDTPHFGRIVTTWGVRPYEWAPIREALPDTYEPLFDDAGTVLLLLHDFTRACGQGDHDQASSYASNLITALTRTLYEAHRLSGGVSHAGDAAPADQAADSAR